MKQSKPLQRKTPLRPGKGFKPKLKVVYSRPLWAATGNPADPGERLAQPSHAKLPKQPAKTRKPMRSRKDAPTAAESAHMGLVAALGCIVCRHCFGIVGTPAIVHHLRTGQGKMRASHYDTLPICPPHHQGSGFGVHDMGRRQFAGKYGISEVELLHIVQGILGVPLWKPTLLLPPSFAKAACSARL